MRSVSKTSISPELIPVIKILVVEPNLTFLHGICSDLEQIGYKAIGAQDKKSATELYYSNKPDLVISDVNIPIALGHSRVERLGIELIKEFLENTPSMGVIFYTSVEKHVEEVTRIYMHGVGGMGYVSKDTVVTLFSIMPSVLAGCWVCILTRRDSLKENSEEILLSGFSENVKVLILEASRRIGDLTDDERETLCLLGESNYSIANHLGIKIGTVEARLKNIYLKLGLDQIDRRLRAILADRALNLNRQCLRIGEKP